ncbi:peptidase inhibitor family I36 protein [Kitasatospora aureofaciens]|uniref:Beta/gamma crystallin 'Greek key' domain-containing protein n=1 Tax=Kitasatospora aureofaciens TaxID=1894 RepID=A0A1E7N9J2_KITAU|nr:peptidase inhibitor family I36 protein [Kitasatospora aureofaciens]ARF82480.1 hypothetical protein B6264_29655 [Kitasatospora aureofaciens]OEV37365.1 hypothetical protein HS99_0006180 [Kitasatospora aureofaciens]GGV00413.1 hypothetical protein GCM10010502_63610 [Kitasatospora aureofaciens]
MGVHIEQGAGKEACRPECLGLYDNYGFNTRDMGKVLSTDEDIPDLRDYDFNDAASSFYNNTERVVTVYKDVKYGGESLEIQPREAEDVPAGWNDTISSVRFA